MNNTIQLLIVAKPATTRRISTALSHAAGRQYDIREAASCSAAEALLQEVADAIILSELELSDGNVLDLVARCQSQGMDNPVLPIAHTGGETLALECMQHGLHHCILDTEEFCKRLPGLIDSLIERQKLKRQNRLSEGRLLDSEERYLDVFDNTSDLIQCLGPDGKFLYTNRAWREALGYDEEEVASLTLGDVLHPDSTTCCSDRFERLKRGETLSKIEFKFLTKAGGTIYLKGDCGSIIKNGEAISTRGIFKNVTDEIKKEQALSVTETRYQSLFENAPDINAIIDKNMRLVSANQMITELLGYDVAELLGKDAAGLIHPEDRAMVCEFLQNQLQGKEKGREIEYRKTSREGSVIWVHMRSSLTADPDGEEQLLLVCRDITENRKLSEQLVYQASHDSLTDLINRREFEKRLERKISGKKDKPSHALCYLDLDQFKIINDACGHLAGDELLRQVSEVLSRQVRARDTLARLGGDEFAVLMDCCSLDEAEQLAERFRKTLEEFRFHWKSRRFSIGVSIGVVPIDSTITSMEQVMSNADAACYAAKEAGRNRIHVYRPDDAVVEHHTGELQWASKITMALEQGRFVLYAQPVFAANEPDRVGCYEILVRLRDKTNTIIRPGAFLAAAERFNLSTKLDRWVLEAVLDWFMCHPDALKKLEMCSVNLSGLSLSDESFLEFVEDSFCQTGFPCHKLCFEITETAAVSNLAKANNFIARLGKKGCHFALDDFGSGLSSYGYLKNMPVDVIKVDGVFVQNIENNEIDRAVVKSICEIAALMGKQTTAEYVESREALDILRGFGVDFVQGNYLGEPLPLDEAMALGGMAVDDKDAVG